jgi:uncharacterized membrane protein
VSPRRLATAVLALVAASLGCHKSAVDCTPPPAILTPPEAGCPTFAAVQADVFVPVCANCHAPGKQEASIPLTTYAQIYGPASGPSMGSEAAEIYNQVFLSCLMPPSNAPAPLTDELRQELLDWFACGAQNDAPPTDAGPGD